MATIDYMEQNCSLSLLEGLDEFYQVNPQLTRRTGTGVMDSFMTNHDTVHVVFGLSTDIEDEMLADCAAFFCCDIGVRRYVSYLKPIYEDDTLLSEVMNDEKIKKSGAFGLIWKLVKTLPKVVRLFWYSRKMKQKWPWDGHQDLGGLSLAEIRQNFRIHLVNNCS